MAPFAHTVVTFGGSCLPSKWIITSDPRREFSVGIRNFRSRKHSRPPPSSRQRVRARCLDRHPGTAPLGRIRSKAHDAIDHRNISSSPPPDGPGHHRRVRTDPVGSTHPRELLELPDPPTAMSAVATNRRSVLSKRREAPAGANPMTSVSWDAARLTGCSTRGDCGYAIMFGMDRIGCWAPIRRRRTTDLGLARYGSPG